MLLTRIRHKGTPHSVPALPTSSNNNGHGGEHDKKYRKGSMGDRCNFWSWILGGAVCSFFSIDYALKGGLIGYNAAARSSSTTTNNMHKLDESILTPLEGNDGSSFNFLQRDTAGGYRFDSLAHVTPDPNQHAILIPYRDRSFHLTLFLEYMGPYLQHHFPHAKFTLWVIEQDDTELFNRAWLANVGLREIVETAPKTSCVIFHDVDLVPNMTSHVPYTTCQYPVQLGSELQHFNWSVPYPSYCGGITTLSLRHWQLINGLGNDYIGWGGEDDDLYHRLRQNGLLVQPTWSKDAAPVPRRPPKGQGIFRTISQKAEHHEQKKTHGNYYKTLELLREMHENSDRWKFDGMNDAYYTITSSKTTNPALGFAEYKHIKAMPQKRRDGTVVYSTAPGPENGKPIAPLEFVHVPFTGGQAITKAAAQKGIVWAACHYGTFTEWDCPPHISGDYQHAPIKFKASFSQAQRPWQIPQLEYLENPMDGTKRFTVVRHPYSRAISFYRFTYDRQHGYPHGYKYHSMVEDPDHPPLAVANYIRDREHPAKLNRFLQEFFIREHHPHKPDGVELIPQVNFIYYRGIKYVHHVLHYEFLQRDFKNILEKYEMKDAIVLPPPDRKRKRKKQYVKKYEEKRVPKTTWTWWDLFVKPFCRSLGWKDNSPPVVDMSLTEIEDEYLLGAQDLEEETVAMLNDHFESDFKKFHYAKIKVNATTDSYWNPIQVVPRESSVAKQQNDRNAALNKAKGPAGAAAKPQTVAQAAPKTEMTQQQKDALKTLTTKDQPTIADRKEEFKKRHQEAAMQARQEMEAKLNQQLLRDANKEIKSDPAKTSSTKMNMREMATHLRDQKESDPMDEPAAKEGLPAAAVDRNAEWRKHHSEFVQRAKMEIEGVEPL